MGDAIPEMRPDSDPSAEDPCSFDCVRVGQLQTTVESPTTRPVDHQETQPAVAGQDDGMPSLVRERRLIESPVESPNANRIHERVKACEGVRHQSFSWPRSLAVSPANC